MVDRGRRQRAPYLSTTITAGAVAGTNVTIRPAGPTIMALNIVEMRRKAEEGSYPSQCMLGLCYLYGIDVETNYEEAFRFLSAAAEQRASRAVLNL
jgi:TPR repeat protein